MLPICGFYNTFSISASFDPLQVSPDIQVPQVPKNGRVRWRMALSEFFLFRVDFYMYSQVLVSVEIEKLQKWTIFYHLTDKDYRSGFLKPYK